RAFDLGEDRPRVRIPLGNALTALDLLAVLDAQARAGGNAMGRTFGAVRIDDGDHHVTNHGDVLVVRIASDIEVLDLDLPLKVRLHERLLRDLRRTTDMEGAHGELGT